LIPKLVRLSIPLAMLVVLVACSSSAVPSQAVAAAVASSTPASTAAPTATASPTPRPTPRPTPTPEPTPSLYKPGDVIEVTSNGDPWANITISKVHQVRKYDGAYNFDDVPTKGNVYLETFVAYEALDDGVNYGSFDWQVFADGTAVDSYTFVSNGPEPTLGSGSLPKGRKASGYIVYEVPATGKILMSYGGTYGEAPVFEVVLRAN
jgi:hypothetical protein